MASADSFHVVIVGCGIGGLCAAIALRKPGRRVTILEQSRFAHEIGATISMQPNASRMLKEKWGIDGVEGAKGIIDHGFHIFDSDGDLVREVPFSGMSDFGADRVVYHRQDLHSYLYRTATTESLEGPAATVRTSFRVQNCDCFAGTVTSTDGEQLSGDLIVAADGIHSVIRELVIGQKIVAQPTGLSAYRMMIPTSELEEHCPTFCERIKPRQPFTSFLMAHECRLVMGPAREGEFYSIVGIVPDGKMNEDADSKQSWVSRGDVNLMLMTFKNFPDWVTEVFKLPTDLGLWQLRDIDPLPTWTKGRTILIGDAAHAMLPTQGQGGSQAVEDGEALGAFFRDLEGSQSESAVAQVLKRVFDCRYERASLIQAYSRQAARPATAQGSKTITMKPDEFNEYNHGYSGAPAWESKQ